MKGKGSIPPPRTYHSTTSYWHRDNGCGQLLVFSGGAIGASPVKDRKVYKFDLGVCMYFCVECACECPYSDDMFVKFSSHVHAYNSHW